MALTLRRFFSVSGWTFLSRLTGFLNVALLGAVLGLTPESDAFMVANVLPNIIYEIVLGGFVSSVFLPMFARRRATLPTLEYRREASQLVVSLTCALLLLSIFAALLATPAVAMMTLGDTPETTRLLAADFFRIFAFQIVFYGLTSLTGAILNAEGRFTIAAAAPVINNVIVAITLGIYAGMSHLGLQPALARTILAIGVTAGVAAMAIAQLYGLRRAGWSLDVGRPRLNHPLLREALLLGLPVIALVVIQQIALAVRSNLATSIPGGFTALQHVFRFFQLPYGILAVTVATLAMPGLAGLSARGDHEGVRLGARRAIVWTIAMMLPVSIAYALLAPILMQLLMSWGRMGTDGAQLLGELLVFYGLAVFPYSILMLVVRIFYALADTRTPVMLLAATNVISIMGCLWLFPVAGLHGMAMAMLITYGLGASAALMLLLRRSRIAESSPSPPTQSPDSRNGITAST